MRHGLILALLVVAATRFDLFAADDEHQTPSDAMRAMRERIEATRSNALARGGHLVPNTFVVNGGKLLTNSRTITIEPTNSIYYPQIGISLDSPGRPEMFQNPSRSFTYTLPERNGRHWLYLQYFDSSGRAIPPMFSGMVELDTVPPVIHIESPKDGSTTDQGFVHVNATAFDPDPVNPTKPRFGQRLGVWINGQRFWNTIGTNIDIPRFDIQRGNQQDEHCGG